MPPLPMGKRSLPQRRNRQVAPSKPFAFFVSSRDIFFFPTNNHIGYIRNHEQTKNTLRIPSRTQSTLPPTRNLRPFPTQITSSTPTATIPTNMSGSRSPENAGMMAGRRKSSGSLLRLWLIPDRSLVPPGRWGFRNRAPMRCAGQRERRDLPPPGTPRSGRLRGCSPMSPLTARSTAPSSM